MNILVPVDFSKTSKNAIAFATELFKDRLCHFFVVFVNIEGRAYSQKPVHLFGTNVLVEQSSVSIDEMLLALEEELKALPYLKNIHNLTVLHKKGTFLKSIRKVIKNQAIDLIVMGTKGASELKEFFMGTSTGDVITKVECDVLAIPDKAVYKNLDSVVFATDFTTSYPDKIYQRLLHFVNPKTTLQLLFVGKPGENLTENQEAHKKTILKMLSKFLPIGINYHAIHHKNVEDAIRIFSQSVEADLIAMVSKDYGFFHKQFLDTTVEEVGFKTTIPLLSLQT